MADPVIGATVQVLLEKLLSRIIEEFNSLRDFNEDLEMLTQNVSLIQTFIHDAERQPVAKQQAVEEWLKMLERVAEDAENVFDEFTYESLEIQVRNSPMKKASRFLFPRHMFFKRKMSGKIKKINKKFTAINKSANELGLQSLPVPPRKTLPNRETDSVVVPHVFGRDKVVAEIKEKILNMGKDAVLCTIPIVGMGGLGKTTVAKSIFRDEQIEKHFEKRVWLCLPEMAETKSFLEVILESLTKRKVEVQSRDIIVQNLQDEFGGKRYLLVLDDLWAVDSYSWHEFMDTLKGINTSRGNCILVTTRMNQVASTVAVEEHMLEGLARDHCWSIFKQRAFVDGKVPEEMMSMENRIVEMCQGLPLAANVLGGLLCNKEKHQWQEILDGNPLVAGEDHNEETRIKKILKLSYDYLPSPHLKKCFAYFAMFPKDFKFQKDQLIQLWMAEGFLHPCPKTPVTEDVGNNFFQLLLQFSLLQDVELDEHNNLTHCKMHDFVHDLAGDILKSQVRYFGWNSPSDQIDKIKKSGRLCTLFWKRNISGHMLLSFKFLRVLNLSGSGIEELSAKIGKLIFLRYLDVSRTEIEDLPNSICKLYNLQTLRVNYCYSLRKLPEEIANMISLRHIYCRLNIDQMPLNMGQLTNLQTLPFFCVGLEKGRRIEELGCLENLRGELTIKHLELVGNKEDARTTYLREKSNIYKLAYLWSRNESEGCEINDEDVLGGLQPHPNLKTLEVESYLGNVFPSWFSEKLLPNLVKLKLSYCRRCKEIPSIGQLKFLRNLELVGFHELERIGHALYGVEISNIGSSSNIQVFPSLKELVLQDMRSLIDWKGAEVGVRMFPGLEKLRIYNCPLLKSTPSQFEILRELEIHGVDSGMPLLNLCSNLTSLVDLVVNTVKELTCLPDEMLRNNVSLQHLSVSDCREFRELPQSLYNLHSLERLEIYFCPNFSSFPVPSGENNLTSLKSLKLYNCDGFTSLPSGMLEQCRSLDFLQFNLCKNLVSLPLDVGEMPSLLHLNISECPKLISVPTGDLHRLTGLRVLEIGPFSEMVDFEAFQLIFNDIQQLLSLRTLKVCGHGHWDSLPYQLMQIPALTDMIICGFGIDALPDRLGNLTSLEKLHLRGCNRLQHVDFSDVMPKLRHLRIYDCASLEALSDGLGNLVSLELLSLWDCEQLEHLPSRDVMRRLTKLCSLLINGCPKLAESCTNSQRSKISHIPNIEVNRRMIKGTYNPFRHFEYELTKSKVMLERCCDISSQNPWAAITLVLKGTVLVCEQISK